MHWDVSYKVCKHLCQYHSQSIFKRLITYLNEVGEIRMQFYVYTDSHEQMVTALRSFKQTNHALGMTGPRHFITDNPSGDKRFFTEMIPSVKRQQTVYDNIITDEPLTDSQLELGSASDYYKSAIVQTMSIPPNINE